jgi:hypothetical protein
LHDPTTLELVPTIAADKDEDVDQLDVRSRKGDDELFMESPSDLETQRDRARVLLPHQLETIEECSALKKMLGQGAGRIRITFHKLEKTNGSYHAKFNLVQFGNPYGNMRHEDSPRPGFAIKVRISKEEGTWLGIQLTGLVLVGELPLDAWFEAVLFAPSDAEAIVNGTTLIRTVELPDDNTVGGRQNAAILEVESRSHKAMAQQSTMAPDLPMNAISATAAFEPACQFDKNVPKNRETAPATSTFHEAPMITTAKMTTTSQLRPTTPDATLQPGLLQQPDTHGHGRRRIEYRRGHGEGRQAFTSSRTETSKCFRRDGTVVSRSHGDRA